MTTVHHADGTSNDHADLADHHDDVHGWVFDNGALGDWWWGTLDGERVLWLVVPAGVHKRGPLASRGLELIHVCPSHEKNNWAQPGPVNGWDGNEDAPTLSPSISVPNGWHGFFDSGRLRNA